MLRSMGAFLSPAGPNGRLSILIYHRVLKDADPLLPDVVDAARFESQMDALGRLFNVIPLSEAVERLRRGALPPRAACVTFDDGYADNFDVALPILKRHSISATFFISTGYLDGGIMFNDKVLEFVRQFDGSLDLGNWGLGVHSTFTIDQRLQAIRSLLSALKYRPMEERHRIMNEIADASNFRFPVDLMLKKEQVQALSAADMEIGGHTVNHPILAKLDSNAAASEIADGVAQLEGIVGRKVRYFAYPNGIPCVDYFPEHVQMVKKLGLEAAVSTARGVARYGGDLFQLPRFTPWDVQLSRFSSRLTGNLLQTKFLTA